MKCTKVLNLAAVLSRDFLFFLLLSLLKQRISHVMHKMITYDSAFISLQSKRKKLCRLVCLLGTLHSN